MQRILLVKCTTNFAATTFPLGLMYLASYLRSERPDLAIKIVDVRLMGYDFEQFERDLAEFAPDLVGVSCLSVELANMLEIARAAKAANPRTVVVAGGPHPSSDPKGTLDNPDVDFAVVGEGELTFARLVTALEAGERRLDGVLGLAWRDPDTGRVVVNPPRPNIEDVGALPRPAWDLVEHEKYWNNWSMCNHSGRYHRYANLFTSRACPYRCTYCHDLFGKGFRGLTPEQTVDEMSWLQATYGVTHFEIVDDIFNANLKRAKAICRLMLERGIKAELSFPNGLRTDMLDKELIGLLKAAGTHHISVAVETVTDRLQKQIKKHLKVDRVWENVEECHRVGIATRGFFMIGFPTETAREVRETIRWAIRSKLTNAFFFIVIPYRGTEIYKENEGRIQEMGIDYSSIDYWTTTYNLSRVPRTQLKRLQLYARMSFYLSPWRLLQMWRHTRQRFVFFTTAVPLLISAFTNRQMPMLAKVGGWLKALLGRGDHRSASSVEMYTNVARTPARAAEPRKLTA